MVPLFILFPVLLAVAWGLGFAQGHIARRDRDRAALAPLAPYTALDPAPPRWEPEQAERVIYPPRPGHRAPRRYGVLPRRSPTRPPRGSGPARRSHEKIGA